MKNIQNNNNNKQQRKGKKEKAGPRVQSEIIRAKPVPRPFADVAAWTSTLQLPVPASRPDILVYAFEQGWPHRKSAGTSDNRHGVAHLARMRALLVVGTREGHGIRCLAGLNVYGTCRDVTVTSAGVRADPKPREDGTYAPGAFYHPDNAQVTFLLCPVGGPEDQDHPGDLAREQGRVSWASVAQYEFHFAVFVDVYHLNTAEFARVWARTWAQIGPTATVYFIFHGFGGALGCSVYEAEVPDEPVVVEQDGMKVTKPSKKRTVRWTEGAWIRGPPDQGGLISFRPDANSSAYAAHPDVNWLLQAGCQDIAGMRCDLTVLDKVGPYSIVACKRSEGALGGLRPLMGSPWEWIDARLLVPSVVPGFRDYNITAVEWWLRDHWIGPRVPERWLLVHRGVVAGMASGYAVKHSRGLTLQQLLNAVQQKLGADPAWTALANELLSYQHENLAAKACLHTAQAVFWADKRVHLNAMKALQDANVDLDHTVKALRADLPPPESVSGWSWWFMAPVTCAAGWLLTRRRLSPMAGAGSVMPYVMLGVAAEEFLSNRFPWFWTCNALFEISVSPMPWSHAVVVTGIGALRRVHPFLGLLAHAGWNAMCVVAQCTWVATATGFSVNAANPDPWIQTVIRGYNAFEAAASGLARFLGQKIVDLVAASCPSPAASAPMLIVGGAVLAACVLGWWFTKSTPPNQVLHCLPAYLAERNRTPSGVAGPVMMLPKGPFPPVVLPTTSPMDVPGGIVCTGIFESEAVVTLVGSGLWEKTRLSAQQAAPLIKCYAEHLKQTPPVAGLYPFFIHDGLLHAPHPGVHSRVQAFLNRVLADPYDGMSIVRGMDEAECEAAETKARLAGHRGAFDIEMAVLEVERWLAVPSILGLFTQMQPNHGGERWYGFVKEPENANRETPAQAHRAMGPRGKRLAAEYSKEVEGKASRPARNGQAKCDETIPLKTLSNGTPYLKPRFLNSYDGTALAQLSSASHLFSSGLKLWWDGIRVWESAGWLVCSACTVGWTSEHLSEMHALAMERPDVITVWTQGDDQKFYVHPLVKAGLATHPYGESDASSCDDTNRAQFISRLTFPVKNHMGIDIDEADHALMMHKRPVTIELDSVKGAGQAHLQKVTCQLPVKMATGHGDTTPGNTLAIGGNFLGWIAQLRPSGERSFEEYAWSMGLKLKVCWRQESELVTFLKCWMVPGPDGPVNQPLPGLLVKLSKIAADPCRLGLGRSWDRCSETERRACLHSAIRSMADGLPHVSREAPLWRAFFALADKSPLLVHCPSAREGLIENYTYRVRGTRLCGEIDVDACFEMFEARYSLTRQDILAMEAEMSGPLPVVCHHFGWARLAEVDYC